MSTFQGHKYSASASQNGRAQLANAYNELGKELSSSKIKVVGNYTLGKVIGEGAYGKVRLGTHRMTATRVAIKQIPKEMSAALTREIHHHRRLHHPHIAQLYEVIATESHIWLITELCSGGELFDYLAEKGRLTEDETRAIFGQLCLAVSYIHENNVVHRDLKLENVLLDEHCRVKLGDFGFTREYERGALLDTYCGTTGYAAPEILLVQKYLGPEVDIWSLGIILYTLLTGTLPFDDDDDFIMREKIIVGQFEIPDWLSPEVRDLIQNVLQHEPAKRLTIPRILAHPWFRPPAIASPTPLTPSTPDAATIIVTNVSQTQSLPSPCASEASFQTASSELPKSAVEQKEENERTIRGVPKQEDDKKGSSAWRRSPKRRATAPPASKTESERDEDKSTHISRDPSPSGYHTAQSAPPTTFPTRTPARTKRRSVSSILSVPSGEGGQLLKPFPAQDYASLLSTPAPLLFSTSLERALLNTLNNTGFDVGQMVHSVISNACDSAGALWWMLKRKAEKAAVEAALTGGSANPSVGTEAETELDTEIEAMVSSSSPGLSPGLQPETPKTDTFAQSISAPQLSFVPATPTTSEIKTGKKNDSPPVTPPRSKSPRSLLSPTPTSSDSHPQGQSKSSPSTPSGSLRDRDRDKDSTSSGSKGRGSKPRSGSVSVSIMQRVATGLESAGLMRKKSAEAVRDDKDKSDKDEKDDKGKRASSSTDSKNGHHPSGHARLTKSPPTRPVKDTPLPSTPDNQEVTASSNLPSSSPWVMPMTRASTFTTAPTPANSPGEASPFSNGDASHKMNGNRNRTSILSQFRLWFNEDRKGKRKAVPPPSQMSSQAPSSPSLNRTRSGTKRRGGMSGFAVQRPRAKRASVSSRRSSSVNSRRSSIASMQVTGLDTPHAMENVSRQRSDPSYRSFTPNSEAERNPEYPSRPSSIHSYNMHQTRHGHRKSPSTSSIGSAVRLARAASPLQKQHRRGGSGSSTRVIRQTRHNHAVAPRATHGRSNSTASSIHSRHSSRPGSFYDASEGEGQRTNSPMPSKKIRRSLDETPKRNTYSTVLVAHKRQTPLGGPLVSASTSSPSISRLSWKKTWGTEPPGWKSRSTQYPVEVLAVFPPAEQPASIRDVFSNRQSLNLGDDIDSDWVDEDEELPTFAGGLGQTWTSASTSKQSYEAPMMLSPPPRANGRSSKTFSSRNNGNFAPRNSSQRAGGWTKPGHSPVVSNMPLPGNDVFNEPAETMEPRSRRQLPPGRSGPAFRQAIQEEDEDEE